MVSLSIILPAYNETRRLPRTFSLIKDAKSKGIFSSVKLETIWVIDDGSSDGTSKYAESMTSELPELKVYRVEPNQGKGNAIQTGLKISKTDWCLIADADSATPWDQFLKLSSKMIETGSQISIGSRDLPESELKIQQSWLREHLGKTFNFVVRLLTGLPFKDTQCGFKLIHKASILPFLELLNVKRFAWDVELLIFARAYGLKITEVAVTWEHQAESKINPVKDGIEMALRVIQMRLRILFIKIKK